MKRLLLAILTLCSLSNIQTFAATTRYVSPTGSGTTCSSGVPCTPVQAISVSVADDIIMMQDGTYTGANYMINIREGTANNGSSGHVIRISAVNDGAVLINGQNARVPVYVGKKFWIVEGINAANSNTSVVQITGQDNIVRRVVAWNADATANDAVIEFYDENQYCLASCPDATGERNTGEDIAAFGTGRKGIASSAEAPHTTIRRAWARFEGSNATFGAGVGAPKQAFDIGYSALYNICENCIATRNENGSYSLPPEDRYGLFGVGRTVTGDCIQHTSYFGSIGYIRASDTVASSDIGQFIATSTNSWVTLQDVIIYIEPGTHTGVVPYNLREYNAGSDSGCPVSDPAPGNRLLTRGASIGGTAANTISNEWVETHFTEAASVAALNSVGAGSIYVNNGAIPTTCYQYVNGSLTSTPLWPWPMNQRIIDAGTTAGDATDNVTTTITNIFGSIPAACGGSSTANYYVSKTGSDAHACSTTDSAGTNKLTVAAGVACLASGDTLTIHTGTYAEALKNPPSGISSSSPTTVKPAAGETVTFTGVTSDSYTLQVENKNFVTIGGGTGTFVFDEDASTYGASIGDSVNGTGGAGSTYVILQNSELKTADVYSCLTNHTSGTAIKSDHISYLNLTIHGCGTTNPTTDTFDGHGIYARFKNSLVEGNTVYTVGNSTIGGSAIQQYFEGNGGEDNNVYRKNTIRDSYGPGLTIADGNNTKVYNNILYGNALKDEGAGGITASAGTDATGIYNNTVYSNNSRGIWIIGGTNAEVHNNISYLNGTADYTDNGTSTIHDHNLESTNPLFTNAGTHDFTLTSTSPAIDQGRDLSTVFTTDFIGTVRPVGTAWDVGAYEFNGTGGGGISCTATSGFDGSEDPLSETSRWTIFGGSGIKKVSGFAQAKGLNEYSDARCTVDALPSDQYETLTWNFNTAASWDIYQYVRYISSPGNGYQFHMASTGTGTGTWQLNRLDSGVATQLSSGSLTLSSVEVIKLSAAASTISVVANGSTLASITDGTYSGSSLFVGWIPHVVSSLTDVTADVWQAGNSATGSITVTTPVLSSIEQRPNQSTVTWSSTLTTGTVDLFYTFDGLVTRYPIAANVVYNASPFLFTPTWPKQTTMQVEVCQTGSTTVCGLSPVFVTLGSTVK